MPSNSNGWILYQGPSELTQQPIVCIVTGCRTWSANPKTGPMLQSWILLQDQHPNAAIQNGADVSVCGDCKLRRNLSGRRVCYVNPAPLGQIWKQYKAGRYPTESNYSAGLNFRIGAYGDPTAVPIRIWRDVLTKVPNATGYTQQWRQPQFQEFRKFCMASVLTLSDAAEAQSLGWRTYRIRGEALAPLEVDCPGAQANPMINCNSCKLCNGKSANISVAAHGTSGHYFHAT